MFVSLSDTPSSVNETIQQSVKWLNDNILGTHLKPWNAFFSGSGKGQAVILQRIDMYFHTITHETLGKLIESNMLPSINGNIYIQFLTIVIENVNYNFNQFDRKCSAYRIDVITHEVVNFYAMISTFLQNPRSFLEI